MDPASGIAAYHAYHPARRRGSSHSLFQSSSLNRIPSFEGGQGNINLEPGSAETHRTNRTEGGISRKNSSLLLEMPPRETPSPASYSHSPSSRVPLRAEEMYGLTGAAEDGLPPIVPPLSRLCRINVAGREYLTTYECLDKYPATLLGCPERRAPFFRPELDAYYFNRSRECFEMILAFYQTGKSYPAPSHVCPELYAEEVHFFGIPEEGLTSSCELSLEREEKGWILSCCSPTVQRVGQITFRTIMDPRYSRIASIWHFLDIIFICISILFMVLETDPAFGHYFVYESMEHHQPYMVGMVSINNIIFGLNSLVIMFFTVDITLRFLTWPGVLSFWRNIFNILDLLSIVPFYISVIAHSMHPEDESEHEEDESVRQKYFILKMCRIFRIIRIFRFVKHSKDLIVIVKVLLTSRKELGLLVILLGISTITFGSVMYYIEMDENKSFNSIMTGCWWALVTITTLGYGDLTPHTVGGKVLGSVLLTFGMVFLTLPMTIIVSKFGTVYENENRKLAFERQNGGARSGGSFYESSVGGLERTKTPGEQNV